MNLRQILTSSIALLLTHAAFAETNPAGAEPITVAASAGNEQRDFFLMHSGNFERVVFSSLVKQIKKAGVVVSDQRAFFQQPIYTVNNSGVVEYFAVSRPAPLKKMITLTVPTGTTFKDFVYNADGGGTRPPSEEFFYVPTKGIYVAKAGTSISIIRPETAAVHVVPGALKDAGNSYADTDHTMQSRYVFGAKVPRKGFEPLMASSSAKDTVLLKDIETAVNVGSNPFDFVGVNHTVFFLTNPDTGGAGSPSLWQLTVDTTTSKPKYSAAIVEQGAGLADPHLYGGGFDLFLSTMAGSDNFHTLFVSTDGVNLNQIEVVDENGDPIDGAGHEPEQITINIKLGQGETGYTSLDTSNNRRFTQYSDTNAASTFTDASATLTNPTLITSTGNYFYYSALFGGTTYLIRDTPGGNGHSNLTDTDGSPDALTDEDGNFLTNPSEIVFVHNPDPTDPDTAIGELYFTADVTRNNVTSTGLLFQFDPNANDNIATTVKTNTHVEVKGAHNLSRVANGQIFRLYFCAPVNTTENSEYLPLDRQHKAIQADFGTKPWVYAPQ